MCAGTQAGLAGRQGRPGDKEVGVDTSVARKRKILNASTPLVSRSSPSPTRLLRQRVREAEPTPEEVEMLGGQTPAPLSEGSPPHTPTPRGGLCPCPRPPPKSQDFCRTGATKEAQLGKWNRLMLFQVLPNLPSTLWKLPPESLTSSPSFLSLPLPPGATTSSCNVP